MTSHTIYRVIRVDIEFDPETTSIEEAETKAIEQVIAEAESNALYNGNVKGVVVTDVSDCGRPA